MSRGTLAGARRSLLSMIISTEAELRAGRPVYIRGLGRQFSGRYLIIKTTHTIGSGGYTTQFDARMEELK